jgi:hypothetical protein
VSLSVVPDLVAAAASHLDGLGSSISAANAAVALPTTEVIAPAADEVSAAIASLFGQHAQEFQALSVQAAKFHQNFVQALSSGANTYAAAEAANTSPLGGLLGGGGSSGSSGGLLGGVTGSSGLLGGLTGSGGLLGGLTGTGGLLGGLTGSGGLLGGLLAVAASWVSCRRCRACCRSRALRR